MKTRRPRRYPTLADRGRPLVSQANREAADDRLDRWANVLIVEAGWGDKLSAALYPLVAAELKRRDSQVAA